MPPTIIVFGATGYTGRLTAERLVAQGAAPVLAGRSEARLRELSDRLGGLDIRTADVDRPESVAALLEPDAGDDHVAGGEQVGDRLGPLDVGRADLQAAQAVGELAQAGLGAAGQQGRGTVRHQALGG